MAKNFLAINMKKAPKLFVHRGFSLLLHQRGKRKRRILKKLYV